MNDTIARPYAKAVFQQAKENKQLEKWMKILQVLSAIVTNPGVVDFYKNPVVSHQILKELINEVMAVVLPDEVKALGNKLSNFIALLLDEKRLLNAPSIHLFYYSLLAKYKNIIEVDVISPFPLDKEQQNLFYKALEKYFSSKISINFLEDEGESSLIGGVIVRSGNWVLDGSLRGKLVRLDSCLKGYAAKNNMAR